MKKTSTYTQIYKNGYSYVIAFSMLSQSLIYAVFAVFNKNAGELNSYIYMIIFALSWIAIFLRISRKKTINIKVLVLLGVQIFIVMHYLLTITDSVTSMLYYYMIWGITPVFLIGLSNSHELNQSIKVLEVLNLIQAVACILVIFRFYTSGGRIVNEISFGGETYNTLSYTAATSLGLLLYFNFFCDKNNRFSLFNYRIIIYIYDFIALLMVVASFMSGGRGGAVCIIAYIIIFFIYFNKVEKKKNRKLIINTFLTIVIIIFAIEAKSDSLFSHTLLRTFSYLKGGKIDITQTSGREYIYFKSIEDWKIHPFVGYGPMNYPEVFYPHNLFLDLLVSGGLLYFIPGLIFLTYSFIRVYKSFKYSNQTLFISFIYISTIIMLMFSGTFYTNIRFWMCFTYFYVFC